VSMLMSMSMSMSMGVSVAMSMGVSVSMSVQFVPISFTILVDTKRTSKPNESIVQSMYFCPDT